MNYELLLRKYMAMILCVEGTTFAHSEPDAFHGFSPEESAVLMSISRELDEIEKAQCSLSNVRKGFNDY